MILTIDVISDVICPWCFIGKRRLEKAIAAVEGQHEFRVRWQGIQDAIVQALFRAYFTEGRDISDRQTLIDVVTEAELDRRTAENFLNSNEGTDAIEADEGQIRPFRVDGVPFFNVNGETTLAGAQPPDAVLAAFNQALGWM